MYKNNKDSAITFLTNINEIDDKFIDEAAIPDENNVVYIKSAKRNTNWRVIAASIVLIFGIGFFLNVQPNNNAVATHSSDIDSCAATPINRGEKPEMQNMRAVSKQNCFNTLKDAEKDANISILIPANYKNCKQVSQNSIPDELIEVIYGTDKENVFTIHKAAKTDNNTDISGDWNKYKTETKIDVNGWDVTIKQNKENVYVALQGDDSFNYSITVEHNQAFSETDIANLIQQIQ